MSKNLNPKITSVPNLFLAYASCGFPSPADDYAEVALDLNKHLIPNPLATFFVQAKGSSMQKNEQSLISDGDLLIVDRSLEAKHKNIVIAIINGEFTVKRLNLSNNIPELLADNPNYPKIALLEGTEFQIWGVVTYVIHKCLKLKNI